MVRAVFPGSGQQPENVRAILGRRHTLFGGCAAFEGEYDSHTGLAAFEQPTSPLRKAKAAKGTMLIPVQLAALRGSEEAHLVLVNEALAAVLVRVLPEPDERPEEGWFLQVGFGPCNREGLIFPTLEAAEVWTRAQFHTV
jgi:hypothetical protein